MITPIVISEADTLAGSVFTDLQKKVIGIELNVITQCLLDLVPPVNDYYAYIQEHARLKGEYDRLIYMLEQSDYSTEQLNLNVAPLEDEGHTHY